MEKLYAKSVMKTRGLMKTPTDFQIWQQNYLLCQMADNLYDTVCLMVLLDDLKRIKVKQVFYMADVSLN